MIYNKILNLNNKIMDTLHDSDQRELLVYVSIFELKNICLVNKSFLRWKIDKNLEESLFARKCEEFFPTYIKFKLKENKWKNFYDCCYLFDYGIAKENFKSIEQYEGYVNTHLKNYKESERPFNIYDIFLMDNEIDGLNLLHNLLPQLKPSINGIMKAIDKNNLECIDMLFDKHHTTQKELIDNKLYIFTKYLTLSKYDDTKKFYIKNHKLIDLDSLIKSIQDGIDIIAYDLIILLFIQLCDGEKLDFLKKLKEINF